MLRQTAILDMFARSPIRPLQKHIEKAHACVEKLLPFYEALSRCDWQQAEKIQQEITELEHNADSIKKDLRLHLPKSLLLPVARGDVLELLSKQDLLANTAKDIAGIMLGRHMQLPEKLQQNFEQFLTKCVAASLQAKKVINELDELLESGFRGKEVDFVEKMINELNEIEHDSDQMQITLRQQLFDIEAQLSAVDIMFLYHIIQAVGSIADCAESVGRRLQILLAR